MIASQLPGLIHFMVYVWWEFSLSYFSVFLLPFSFYIFIQALIPCLLSVSTGDTRDEQDSALPWGSSQPSRADRQTQVSCRPRGCEMC